MNWTRIIAAANGRAQSLAWVVRRGPDADVAALTTLLLLDDAPHPAAALVAVATVREDLAPPIQAALAPHVAPALAAWRADPLWHERAIGADARERLTWSVARMVGALRADPAALHDAVAIVLRDGDPWGVSLCLEALGADGWTALEADRRDALLQKAPADALGQVWDALDDAQRAATVQAASDSDAAAWLIGRIGAAAWRATDPALRKRLIDAAVRDRYWILKTAPAWPGMTDDEREPLASAAMACDDAMVAFRLLDDLGAAGRGALSADLRAALERRAMEHPDAWRVLALRAADLGWTALTADERRAVLAAADRPPWNVPLLLRTVGAAGWRAMNADEQSRLAAMVRRATDAFFRCPPTLWRDLAGDALPPATIAWRAMDDWRAEDADADLGGLPPSHQTLVLALAPWRTEDATKDSVRVPRLCMAWDALTVDERVALATAQPRVLAAVAAAARLADGASAAVDAVGETVARRAAATDRAAATRIVAAMLRTPDRWRAWMVGVAPTDGDPSGAWKAWRAAARRGFIADVALCARLAAKEREEAKPARALRRTGR